MMQGYRTKRIAARSAVATAAAVLSLVLTSCTSGVLRSEVRRPNVLIVSVDSQRLEAVGYGIERPVADNSTLEGRSKNRRVEIVIRQE